MIYDSFENSPPYIYDSWIDWKPASVYQWFVNRFIPLDSHSFIEENFEKKPLNIRR